MPSKSRSQQRLFQAAEHGANFPMAQKLRQTMTHQELHDYAVGSEKGKPEHVQRQLHPALKARAVAVKAAHAHLSKTQPGFRDLPGHQQLRATQQHVTKHAKGRAY